MSENEKVGRAVGVADMQGRKNADISGESDLVRLLYIFRSPVVLSLMLLEVLALLPAAELLADSNWISTYLSFVDGVTNFPDQHARFASEPFRTKLMLAIAVFAAPLMVVLITPRIAKSEIRVWSLHWSAMPKKKLVALAVITLVLYPFVFIGFITPGDPGFCAGCTTHSLLGLFLFYGLGLPYAFSYLLAAHYRLFSSIFLIRN